MERPTAIKFNYPAFIPPGMLRDLQSCPKGKVQREDSIEYMGFTLKSPVPLCVGKEYELQCGSHHILLYYLEDKAAYAAHLKQQRENLVKSTEDKKAQKAAEFWSRYVIPFKFSIQIKEVLSGLGLNSMGNGTNRRTVYHVFVMEAFNSGGFVREKGSSEGLVRKEGSFLCSSVKSKTGGNWSGSLGNEYASPKDTVITCKACLRLMERFKKSPQKID
ncbi:hypothetical protein C7N43_39340 [Sphingobacteriales bacterium UPWRP_1]|nr:hypothetical protein C7N43_39340 [Sphingobacteriales bacterium UPWRP_1]